MSILNQFEISELKRTEIDRIAEITPAEWWDIRPVFHKFFDYEGFYAVKVTFENKFIGVGEVILNETTGWVGNIVVDHTFRKRGVGHKITKHLTDFIGQQGRKTKILLATDLGKSVYEKLGYRTISQYMFFTKNTQSLHSRNEYFTENIRDYSDKYFEAIYQLDKVTYGEDRIELIRRNVKDAKVYVRHSSDEFLGYCLPYLGNGLVVAINKKAGLELLKHTLSVGQGVIFCPEENLESIAFARENGFQFQRVASRMILGQEPNWKPMNIYNRIGGYIG